MYRLPDIADVTKPGAYDPITRAATDHAWQVLADRLDQVEAAWLEAPSLHAIAQLEGTLHAIVRAPLADLHRWVEDRPDDRWGWLCLGMGEAYAGLDQRGIEEADAVPERIWVLIFAHFEEARPALERSIELGGRPGPALYSLGQCALIEGVGDMEHAALLRRLVELEPNWVPGWSSALARSEPRWGGSVASMDELLADARRFITVPELVHKLEAQYWWWRANWAATWENEPQEARDYIARGLAVHPPSLGRDSFHQLEAQILGSIGAPVEEIVAAWQAAVDATPGQRLHDFDLARALLQSGDGAGCLAVMERLATTPGQDRARAGKWLGVRYRYGDGFPADRKTACRWFRLAAEDDPHSMACLGDLLLEMDPDDGEGGEWLQKAMDHGESMGALGLAYHHLHRGEKRQAEARLRACEPDLERTTYALARGLDEGWFGRIDSRGALAVTSEFLPNRFDAWMSVLHMTLLSALGDWEGAQSHGIWLREGIEDGSFAMPEDLASEIDRMLAEIPRPGLGGLVKRMSGRNRLRLMVERPGLWEI